MSVEGPTNDELFKNETLATMAVNDAEDGIEYIKERAKATDDVHFEVADDDYVRVHTHTTDTPTDFIIVIKRELPVEVINRLDTEITEGLARCERRTLGTTYEFSA